MSGILFSSIIIYSKSVFVNDQLAIKSTVARHKNSANAMSAAVLTIL